MTFGTLFSDEAIGALRDAEANIVRCEEVIRRTQARANDFNGEATTRRVEAFKAARQLAERRERLALADWRGGAGELGMQS